MGSVPALQAPSRMKVLEKRSQDSLWRLKGPELSPALLPRPADQWSSFSANFGGIPLGHKEGIFHALRGLPEDVDLYQKCERHQNGCSVLFLKEKKLYT